MTMHRRSILRLALAAPMALGGAHAAPVASRLHAEVQRALTLPEVRDRVAAAGGEVLPGTVEQFAQLLSTERARYERLIRSARIQPD